MNILKKKFNSKLTSTDLFRVISAFFVFAILLNVIYIPCYFYVRHINEKNILDHKQSQLDMGMLSLESSIDALLAMPEMASISADLKTIYFDRDDFNDMNLNRLRKLFKASLSPFDFITEYGLTLDQTILFTRERIYYDNDFLSYTEHFSCSRPDYLSEFSGLHFVLPVARFSTDAQKSSYDAITIAFRWQRSSSMYFYIHCPVDQLFSLFADEELLDCSYMAIYANDVLLAEHGAPLTDSHRTLSVKMNNQLGISAVLQIPNSYITQNMASMTQLIRFFITIVLLVAILWIIVFSILLWRPFRNAQKTLHLTGYLSKDSSGSLIDDIFSLGQQVSYYKEASETQRERNRIHLFEKALYRGLNSEEALLSFSDAFPDFPKSWQLVMLQYIAEDSDISSDALQPTLEQSLQMLFPNMILLPHDQGTLLLLLSAETESSLDTLQSYCTRIEQAHRISITFTHSKVYDDTASLTEAFREIETNEFLSSPSAGMNIISLQQLQIIYSALQCANAGTAISVLQKGTASAVEQNDLFSAKYSYRMLGYVLVSLKMEFTCIADIPIPAFFNDNIRQLFEAEMPQCFRTIAEKIKEQNAAQTDILEQKLLRYIDENLADQQLSVTMVAELFHISASTLQKRMNTTCGRSFSSYVESIRMKQAQQLLRETSHTVQEIAEAVGYINVNSFYKAYRRCFGEPPNAYRNRI